MKAKTIIVGLTKLIILYFYIFTGAWLIELVYTMIKEEGQQ